MPFHVISKMRATILPIFISVISISSQEDCGKLNSNVAPWNVAIYQQFKQGEDLQFLCFGSIIKSNAIITAAHCFTDPLNANLRSGTFYFSSSKLSKNTKLDSALKQINSKSIKIKKGFLGLTSHFNRDIAVITLENGLHFDQKVSPVCIDWSDSIRYPKKGKQIVWINKNIDLIDSELLDYEICKQKISLAFEDFITNDKLCTNTTSDITGSEGSGVLFLHNNLWYLKGVISTVIPHNSTLATYTSINHYLNWLSRKTKK